MSAGMNMERLTARHNGKSLYSGGTLDDVLNKLADYEDAEEQGLLLRLPTGKDRSDLIYVLLELLLRTEWGHCYMCSNPTKNITIDGKNNGCDGGCNITKVYNTDDLLTKILSEMQIKAEAEKALAEVG